jgi:hypothetical protein
MFYSTNMEEESQVNIYKINQEKKAAELWEKSQHGVSSKHARRKGRRMLIHVEAGSHTLLLNLGSLFFFFFANACRAHRTPFAA